MVAIITTRNDRYIDWLAIPTAIRDEPGGATHPRKARAQDGCPGRLREGVTSWGGRATSDKLEAHGSRGNV